MNQIQARDHSIFVNHINLHYIDYENDMPLLLLMHGLTANAHAFDGLVAAGLSQSFRVVSPDLRGRGLSGHAISNYTIEDHAKDIMELIQHLGKRKIFLAGHSFGGYLGFYIAANYPEVVDKLVILDAAKQMNPNAAEMLGNALSRLDITYHSFDDYIAKIKKAPYLTFWDDAMLSYYRADVKDLPDGRVKPRCNLEEIREISYNMAGMDWEHYIENVEQPALLINATDNYTLGEPLLPGEIAKETVAMMKNAQYIAVDGNHQTMLYGNGAKEIVAAMEKFL